MSRRLKKLLSGTAVGLVCMLTGLAMAACDVHEEPSSRPQDETLILQLEFNTGFGIINFDYTRSETSVHTRYSDPEGTMKYKIRAYRLADGNVVRDDFEEFTLTREVKESDYDCETSISLAPGLYRIYVWADFEVDGTQYYDSDNFSEITVKTDPYTGDTDYRDAFKGQLDIVRIGGENDDNRTTGTIQMRRPMAKYEFISTGLKEFISKEQTRRSVNSINLNDYYAVFSYPQYMPSAFNMFADQPNNSVTGIKFRSSLTQFSDDEVSLGFDYVFVSYLESSVMVQVAIYTKDGDRLTSMTPMIKVPLSRNYETLVRGNFMNIIGSEGVGINPGYDGDFNMDATLKEN